MAPEHLARQTTACHTHQASAKPPKRGSSGLGSPTYPAESLRISARVAHDQDLPEVLAEGVHTGVFSEIKPSGLWPPAKLQPLSQSGLEVCQGNWRPAEEDPETVAALLAEEEAAGWIQQVPGGLKAAKKRWPKGVAVGKLSLVKAEGRDPRLVLDSTVCQVNPLCRIPEAVTMPTVQEVRRSFQPQDPRGAYISASIDFKAAHKRVKVHDTEQGLLLFAFNGTLWRYVVCHFGAKFSAYWWQRVGGLITRNPTCQPRPIFPQSLALRGRFACSIAPNFSP